MEEATRREPGCVTYVSSVDIHDPTLLRISEVWESMEAIEPHFGTAHIQAFREALGALDTKRMVAKAFDVRGEIPFPG